MALTQIQQTLRVAYLGILFLIMFTTFNSLQNIVSKIYKEYDYHSLGQISLLVLYLVFAIATLFTPYVIKTLGYKKVMFLSSLGYSLFQGMGLILVFWEQMPKLLGWILVLLGAIVCGIAASMLWVAQGSYVNEVAGSKRKTELNGLFWGLMMSSQVTGSLLTTFVLGLVGKTVYFLVLTILGFSSSFLFLLLPDISVNKNKQQVNLAVELRKIGEMIRNPVNRQIIIYYFFPGLCVGFYATYIYRLVTFSLPQLPEQTTQDYSQRLDFRSGLVFIALGVSQALTGLFMNRCAQHYDKFKLAITGTLLVEVACFVSLLCYFLQNYELCFLVSFLWGSSETFLQTNTGALIGKIFPGQVESYSVYRVVFAFGVVLTILLNILLKDAAPWIFLSLVTIVQILTSRVSVNLATLKKKDQTEPRSLISVQSMGQ